MPGVSDRWYFCLKHHHVEGAEGCPGRDRLGPYPTRAAAQDALATVQRRNEEWDNDPRWNDDDS